MKKSSKTEIRTGRSLTDYQHRLSIGRLTYITAVYSQSRTPRNSKQRKNSFPPPTLSCLLPKSSAEEHDSRVPSIPAILPKLTCVGFPRVQLIEHYFNMAPFHEAHVQERTAPQAAVPPALLRLLPRGYSSSPRLLLRGLFQAVAFMPYPLLQRVHGCTKRSAPRGACGLQATVCSTACPSWAMESFRCLPRAPPAGHFGTGRAVPLILNLSPSCCYAVLFLFPKFAFPEESSVLMAHLWQRWVSFGASGAGCVHRETIPLVPCNQNLVMKTLYNRK